MCIENFSKIELLSTLDVSEASTRRVLKHKIGYYISDGGPIPCPFNSSSVCSVHKYIFARWMNYVWLEKMGSCEKPILALLLKTMPLNKVHFIFCLCIAFDRYIGRCNRMQWKRLEIFQRKWTKSKFQLKSMLKMDMHSFDCG